jgi:hypothetical protein
MSAGKPQAVVVDLGDLEAERLPRRSGDDGLWSVDSAFSMHVSHSLHFLSYFISTKTHSGKTISLSVVVNELERGDDNLGFQLLAHDAGKIVVSESSGGGHGTSFVYNTGVNDDLGVRDLRVYLEVTHFVCFLTSFSFVHLFRRNSRDWAMGISSFLL